MIIRDYQDYREMFCGPCCPNPDNFITIMLSCNSVRSNGDTVSFTDNDQKDAIKRFEDLFHTQKVQYSDNPQAIPPATGHITTYTYDNLIRVQVEGETVSPPIVQSVQQSGGTSFKQPTTTTYSSVESWTSIRSQMVGMIDQNHDYDKGLIQVNHIQGANTLCQSFLDYTTVDAASAETIPPHQLSHFRSRYKVGFDTSLSEDLSGTLLPKYHKVSWDEYFMSNAYAQYISDFRVWEFLQSEHDKWVECEKITPGFCGPEPIVPDKPTEPTPKPEHIAHREWEYTAGSPPASDWFELPVKDIPEFGQDGGYVINNIQVLQYRSATLGSVPVSFQTGSDYPLD